MAENRNPTQPHKAGQTPSSAASAPAVAEQVGPPPAKVVSGTRNFRVMHQMFGAFDKDRIISDKMITDMKYDLERGVRLGAIVETNAELTEHPIAPGPDNPNAIGGYVSDGSYHAENDGKPHGTPNRPPHFDNTPAGTQGLSTARTGVRQLDTDTPSRKTGASEVEGGK